MDNAAQRAIEEAEIRGDEGTIREIENMMEFTMDIEDSPENELQSLEQELGL